MFFVYVGFAFLIVFTNFWHMFMVLLFFLHRCDMSFAFLLCFFQVFVAFSNMFLLLFVSFFEVLGFCRIAARLDFIWMR